MAMSMMSAGFLQQFAAVCHPERSETNMAAVLRELSGSQTPTRVICTGHSLGGALATLGLHCFAQYHPAEQQCAVLLCNTCLLLRCVVLFRSATLFTLKVKVHQAVLAVRCAVRCCAALCCHISRANFTVMMCAACDCASILLLSHKSAATELGLDWCRSSMGSAGVSRCRHQVHHLWEPAGGQQGVWQGLQRPGRHLPPPRPRL